MQPLARAGRIGAGTEAMLNVISAEQAIDHILRRPARHALYLGAGVSAEAGVGTAEAICEEIRSARLERGLAGEALSKAQIAAWARETLSWDQPSQRYMACIRAEYPIVPERIDAFRDMLRDRRPAFCHHAVALLMSQPDARIKRVCLTTNFDHLLEDAFTQQGFSDFQAIRGEHECRFFRRDDGRAYVIKLHGDIDTENILNTEEETEQIADGVGSIAEDVARDAGLVVIGTAGHERSVRSLFLALRRVTEEKRTLSFGLLWGVYMGPKPRSGAIKPKQLEKLVRAQVAKQVNPEIVAMMESSTHPLFCFFPVWGAGEFMWDLVLRTKDRSLIEAARLRLDHEMRLRQVFRDEAGLTDEAVEGHLAALQKGRKTVEREKARRVVAARREVDEFLSARARNGATELRVMYADITSRSLMGAERLGSGRRAVVSPEDRFVSAGGGVAFQLLFNAGPDTMLNELAKFAPIPHRAVAVTSGGALPVHYVFHAAALNIGRDGEYQVSGDDVTAVMVEILEKASALDVGVVLVPLMGTGIAPVGTGVPPLQPDESFEALLEGVGAWTRGRRRPEGPATTVCLVIYQEKLLARADARDAFDRILGPSFDPSETAAASAAA